MTDKKIEKAVVNTHKKIEKTVVDGYKTIEEGAVGGFKKVSDKFVEKLFKKEDESVSDAKDRLKKQQEERAEAIAQKNQAVMDETNKKIADAKKYNGQ